MNTQEAKTFFQEFGGLLAIEPDRNARKAYIAEERQSPDYQDALSTLQIDLLTRRLAAIENEIDSLCPKQLTSFNPNQLYSIWSWWEDEAETGIIQKGLRASEIIDRAERDERGKLLSDKGRTRLRLGVRLMWALDDARRGSIDLDKVDGNIEVWQIAPDEIEARGFLRPVVAHLTSPIPWKLPI